MPLQPAQALTSLYDDLDWDELLGEAERQRAERLEAERQSREAAQQSERQAREAAQLEERGRPRMRGGPAGRLRARRR